MTPSFLAGPLARDHVYWRRAAVVRSMRPNGPACRDFFEDNHCVGSGPSANHAGTRSVKIWRSSNLLAERKTHTVPALPRRNNP